MSEWNILPHVEARLESVAREAALKSQEGHNYLPKTPDEAVAFTPHEWVREAMRRAYSMGRTAGRYAAKADMREAFGLSR